MLTRAIATSDRSRRGKREGVCDFAQRRSKITHGHCQRQSCTIGWLTGAKGLSGKTVDSITIMPPFQHLTAPISGSNSPHSTSAAPCGPLKQSRRFEDRVTFLNFFLVYLASQRGSSYGCQCVEITALPNRGGFKNIPAFILSSVPITP